MPIVGFIPVIVGPSWLLMVKLKLVDPPLAFSVTDATPTDAVAEILNVALRELPLDSRR
jgi:hypothetical protein